MQETFDLLLVEVPYKTGGSVPPSVNLRLQHLTVTVARSGGDDNFTDYHSHTKL